MSIKDWADLASAVQSVVLTLAVLVGGGWALFQFISLNAIAKARTELETAKRGLRERGLFSLTIEHHSITSLPGANKCLLCTVHIENLGNGMESINWQHSKFTATPIVLENKKAIALVDQMIDGTSCQPLGITYQIVIPGEKCQIPYVVCLPGPGLYSLSFTAATSRVIQKELMLQLPGVASNIESLTWDWNTSIIIAVE